jgi:hypothetical protein
MDQGWRSQRLERASEAPLMRRKEVRIRGSEGPSWFDGMLGEGSSKTLGEAARGFGRQRRQASESPKPRATKRIQATNAKPEGELAKPKGVLRLAALVLALAVAGYHFRPWKALSGFHWIELKAPKETQNQAENENLAEATPEVTPEAIPTAAAEDLSKLPLGNAAGAALALWQSSSGQWYGVNAHGELSGLPTADAVAKLNLPQISGPKLLDEERNGQRVLRLDLDAGQLKELLPLSDELVAAVDRIVVDGRDFSLRLNSGALADLGEDGFQGKEVHLGSVLADLAARNKEAAAVDLRYDNSAVVRLASR